MYENFIQTSAALYGVPFTWIQAVIETESSWKPTAHVTGDGYGLMQLLDTTAKALGYTGAIPGTLYDPATNIDLGTKYLAQLRVKYGDDFQRVYSAYNSGNPDAYLNPGQVQTNVARAVTNLMKWTDVAMGTITAMPASSATVMLFAAILIMLWVKKK